MTAPCTDEVIVTLSNDPLYGAQITDGQAVIHCQFDSRLEPVLCLAAFAVDVDVTASLLAREEKEAKALLAVNGRTQSDAPSLGCRRFSTSVLYNNCRSVPGTLRRVVRSHAGA